MKGPTEADLEAILGRLGRLYGHGDWRVPYLRAHARDPFQVLIGTILSQRTRDENTDRASLRLFARFPDARALARASLPDIEALIRGTGFYRVKARNIRKAAQEIQVRFGGAVPPETELLLSLPGVGRKTANCVRVFGFGLPAIPVDTHVHRIANRLGWVRTRGADETERRLATLLPERFWIPLNPALVQHGQNLCRPLRPRCPDCPIWELCATGRALRAGRAPPRPADRRPRNAGLTRPVPHGRLPAPRTGRPTSRR